MRLREAVLEGNTGQRTKCYRVKGESCMLLYKGKELRLIGNGVLEVDFTDGESRRYDMARLIPRHPIVQSLIDEPELFGQGKLFHNGMTVYWNDDIDVSIMTVYECGEVI